MEEPVRQLVRAIHDARPRFVMATAGAGTKALYWLQSEKGAHKTIIEAVIPYSRAALRSFVGFNLVDSRGKTENRVSPVMSRVMAASCIARARLLATDVNVTQLFGVSCTAAVTTDRPRRGKHHAYVSTWCHDKITTYELVLSKGARTRQEEEEIVSRVILNAMADLCHLQDHKVTLPLQEDAGDDSLTVVCESNLQQEVANLLAGQWKYLVLDFKGELTCGKLPEETAAALEKEGESIDLSMPNVILPGSFNPLHWGHVGLMNAACRMVENPRPSFEISAFNVDKPTLPIEIILARTIQFAGGLYSVAITNAPTFVEKSNYFKNSVFVVGMDTARRVVDESYYDNSKEKMHQALKTIMANNCSFLVAGRLTKDGAFEECTSLQVDEEFRPLFNRIPESEFRNDISSTAIRQLESRRRSHPDLHLAKETEVFTLSATAGGDGQGIVATSLTRSTGEEVEPNETDDD